MGLFYFCTVEGCSNAVIHRLAISLCGGGKAQAQAQTTSAEPQFLFHGCQMSRLLQDHNSFQPCPDRCIVCLLFHGFVPANWRPGSSDRRLLFQEETKLSLCHTTSSVDNKN